MLFIFDIKINQLQRPVLPNNNDFYKCISISPELNNGLDTFKNNGSKWLDYKSVYGSISRIIPDYNSTYKCLSKVGAAVVNNATQIISYNLKGINAASQFFQLKLNQGNCLVKILDYSTGKWKWSIRFDRPHKFVEFPHINWNPKITRVPDPHTPISQATLSFVKNTAEVSKEFSKFDWWLPVIIDASYISYNMFKDYQQGTVRNSITATSSVSCSWIVAASAAKLGVIVGSTICPGFGTVAGAFLFGIPGAIYGGLGGQKLVDFYLDSWKNGIETFNCNLCNKDFECRKYKGQSRDYCIPCNNVAKLTFSYNFIVPLSSSSVKVEPLPSFYFCLQEPNILRLSYLKNSMSEFENN